MFSSLFSLEDMLNIWQICFTNLIAEMTVVQLHNLGPPDASQNYRCKANEVADKGFLESCQ